MSYCKSSNKATRLPPVTGFNIGAQILPESLLCQLKNVKRDLKGYYTAQWARRDILLLTLFFSLIFRINISISSPLQTSCLKYVVETV